MIVIHVLYAPSLSSLTDKAHFWQYYIAFFGRKLNPTSSIDMVIKVNTLEKDKAHKTHSKRNGHDLQHIDNLI
jgi:hypothetical protein